MVVFRLPFTTPSYEALSTVSLIPASPRTINRRRTRKAVMRVASAVATSAQIPTTTLVRALSSFLNWRRYGSIGSMDERVIFNV